MRVTITASTGARIDVWRDGDLFHAVRDDRDPDQPQICLGVDLFEVIAELAGLDLDRPPDVSEATSLAETAQRQLSVPERGYADHGWTPSADSC